MLAIEKHGSIQQEELPTLASHRSFFPRRRASKVERRCTADSLAAISNGSPL
jgi:hypothetical protein